MNGARNKGLSLLRHLSLTGGGNDLAKEMIVLPEKMRRDVVTSRGSCPDASRKG